MGDSPLFARAATLFLDADRHGVGILIAPITTMFLIRLRRSAEEFVRRHLIGGWSALPVGRGRRSSSTQKRSRRSWASANKEIIVFTLIIPVLLGSR